VSATLSRPYRLSLDSFARAAGLHPDMVRRLVALDLLDPTSDAAGALWFAPTELARLGRLQRLRAGLALNWAALGVVIDLLDRIDELETALRAARQRSTGGRPWT
jgi:hypothetical protein